jgi:hypothetical protein
MRREERAYDWVLQSPPVVGWVGLWFVGMIILGFAALALHGLVSALSPLWPLIQMWFVELLLVL